jgi:Major Facilitator Superfamily
VGGFIGETIGWRWVEGVMAIFTGALWIIGSLLIPETYAPVILSKRARNLSKRTGMVYKSRLEVGPHARNTDPKVAIRVALSRPWILLLKEPIVLLLSIYMAILYGTLYMLFGAFPIVYQETRGWSEGIGGLAFTGVAVGFIIAVFYILMDNKRYERTEDEYISQGYISAPPEARLPPCMVGCIWIPIGMFWFAWTNGPNIHWAVSIVAGIPFGFGMLLVFVSIMNYLIDSYTVYAASVLAANSVLRSLFGAVFPLFTSQMYANLGIHWASSIPAFLALMCVPFPFLFYKFGPSIRKRCAFAKEAMEVLQQLKHSEGVDQQESGVANEKALETPDDEKEKRLVAKGANEYEFLDAPEHQSDPEKGEAGPSQDLGTPMSQVRTQKSTRSMRSLKSIQSSTRPSLRTQPSTGHLALDRARSYASNW